MSIEAINFILAAVIKASLRKVLWGTIQLSSNCLTYDLLCLKRIQEMPVCGRFSVEKIDKDRVFSAENNIN